MGSNDAFLSIVRDTRLRLEARRGDLPAAGPEATQAKASSSLSVADVARIEGIDPDEAMWLLRPDVAVLAELPVTGDHHDIDALALPEFRRPELDAPISAMLAHVARLGWGRLSAWIFRFANRLAGGVRSRSR